MSIQSDASSLLSYRLNHSIRCSLLLLLSLALMVSPLVGQDEKEIPALEEGKLVQRELSGGQSQSYRVDLAAGQFLHAIVEQRSIDVMVRIFAPDGQKLLEVDNPNSKLGPESVSVIAETPGRYRLEVRPLSQKAVAGRYEIRLDPLHAVTAKDRLRLAAEKGFIEAQQLVKEAKTPELQRAASDRLEENVLLWRQLGGKYWEAFTLASIAGIRRSQNHPEQALTLLNQALSLYRALGDQHSIASTLYDIAAAYDYADENQKAIEPYKQALELYRQLKDQRSEAATLYALGTAYDELGEKQKALEVLDQALTLRRALKDNARIATILYYIGTVYDDLNNKQKALELFTEALPFHRAAADRYSEARTLDYMGELYLSSGQNEQALKHYHDALTIRHEINDQRGETDTLNNLGLLYDLINKANDSLQSFTQARTLARAINYSKGEAQALNGLGGVYNRLDDLPKALRHHNLALEIWRKIGDKEGEAQTLTLISNIYSLLGENRKAREASEQASPIIEGLGDKAAEAAKLFNTGLAYFTRGEFQKAVDVFNRVLAIAHIAKQDRMVSHIPVLIGLAYYQLDEDQKAFEQFTSTLPFLQSVGNRTFEALALAGLAAIERDRGNLAEAKTQIETALKIIESLRADVAREDLRLSVFASAQDYFELYIGILMELHKQEPSAGHDGEAFQASELGRARSLLESLNEAKVDIRQGVDPVLIKREQALRQQLNVKAQQQQMRPLGGQNTEKQMLAAADEIESLTTQLQQVEAEIRQKSPAYAALTQPQPLTLKEIQTRVLDEDTLLLEYSLGKDHSYLWAVTPSSVASYELPNRAEIDAAARKVYELLNARTQAIKGETDAQRQQRITQADAEYPAAAARLSRMVLSPVAQQLGGKRLLIVAHGTLQYIPFGALPDPALKTDAFTPLIINHEIVSVLSASTLALLRQEMKGRPLAPKAVAVLADPVFSQSDERLRRSSRLAPKKAPSRRPYTSRRIEHDEPANNESSAAAVQSALRIKRLPYTRQEAEEILKIAAPEESARALDFAANRQFVTDPQLSRYRYVHFATHGFLNSEHPELSGIVLSMVDEKGAPQNGFLRAHEIFNLKLPAELVVLSACQTGLGKEVRGEGLVGLTRGFMYAGAPRVVVSLWSVSDRATAELMVRFYRGMLKEKMRPAAALRAAQVSLMKERGWESPFYWAAFTLQGEWK